MVAVTPSDVAQYAPDAPVVTQVQLDEASDWAEQQFEHAGRAQPMPDTRQERELRRAICAYVLSRATLGGLTATSQGDGRLARIKDGDSEISYQATSRTDAVDDLGDWERRAWAHLVAAGLPRPPVAPGYSL